MNEAAYNYEVFIGTYEHFLLSYKIRKPETESYFLERCIAQRTHTASIRCIDTKGRYLATGGTDDRICILDLKLNQEIQMLTHHNGNVNDLKFTPECSYLLSASDDGSMVAVKTGSWMLNRKWSKAHTGKPITYISIHPSGHLALTLGRDDTVRTWNLLTGQQAFTTNLKTLTPLQTTVQCVVWSPNGSHFAMLSQIAVLVMSMKTAAIVKDIRGKFKPESICWLNDTLLLVGNEKGEILFSGVNKEENIVIKTGNTSRVKAMDYVSSSSKNGILGSVTSDGQLCIWNVSIKKKKLTLLCSTNIDCRPTCLTLVNATTFRKREVVKEELDDTITTDDSLVQLPTTPKKSNRGTIEMEIEDEDNDMVNLNTSNDKSQSDDRSFEGTKYKNEQLSQPEKKKKRNMKRKVNGKPLLKQKVINISNSDTDFEEIPRKMKRSYIKTKNTSIELTKNSEKNVKKLNRKRKTLS